jgi:apolipoprotein N-acyltransferase
MRQRVHHLELPLRAHVLPLVTPRQSVCCVWWRRSAELQTVEALKVAGDLKAVERFLQPFGELLPRLRVLRVRLRQFVTLYHSVYFGPKKARMEQIQRTTRIADDASGKMQRSKEERTRRMVVWSSLALPRALFNRASAASTSARASLVFAFALWSQRWSGPKYIHTYRRQTIR